MSMTRARLFTLINSFERDIRSILQKYVVEEIGERAALAHAFEGCLAKSESDPAGESVPLVEYLDTGTGYDLLNAHRGRLPSDLEREVRELTQNLDRIIGVRNRVMHARPLAAGDSEAATSHLNQYQTPYWVETRRTLAQLMADPTWEPKIVDPVDESATLHNLPLPDYDDTGLIGRGHELQHLVSLLKRGRESVITVTGEGGIGKTALALEIAYQLVDDPDKPFDAVLWTSLKFEKLTAFGVREISGAARDIIGAIQPAARTIATNFVGSVQELSELLDGFRVLLIIDNLETVSGEEFKELYEQLPDEVSYLITSRIGVGEYERRYPLDTLSDNDSLNLFNQFVRARKIDSLNRLSKETRLKIVSELRYSPLAIKWFSLAVEAGNDPINLLRKQDDLLEFCVRSVYDDLSRPAQEVLVALAVIGRTLSTDELVVLLDRPMDDVAMGVQELMRGSLVRRESLTSGDLLLFRLVLTDTARQFLSRRVQPDQQLQRQLEARDKEFRAVQEMRANDLANRSLAPIVVRERNEADAPTSAVLRQALLLTRRDTDRSDRAAAYEKIDLARRMNPDFWEVDRVEGFVRDVYGDLTAATACYERAYANANGEDRAVVSHFFAGHLARKVRDLPRAVTFAREAHEVLGLPDTGTALGTYLVWSHQYEGGIALLEAAVPLSEGKSKVIAITSLASALGRAGTAAKEQSRNPLRQFTYAWRGFQVCLAAIEAGIVDERLKSAAMTCAVVALKGAADCLAGGIQVQKMTEYLDILAKSCVRFNDTSSWMTFVIEVERFSTRRHASAAAKRLLHAVRSLDSDGGSQGGSQGGGDHLVGEVVSNNGNYGFIRHPSYPENLFFHRGSVDDTDGMDVLTAGSLVQFAPEAGDKGPRAVSVSRA